jgi:hypothetical protein
MTEPKLSVYVETSVWSFALADDAPDYRADTEEFFHRCRRGAFEPFISTLVLEEINRAEPGLRRELERLIGDIGATLFDFSEQAAVLAKAFLAAGVVPPSKPEDAGHVAAAFEEGLDVLVSWNFRHIANIRRAERFNAVAVLPGLLSCVADREPSRGDVCTRRFMRVRCSNACAVGGPKRSRPYNDKRPTNVGGGRGNGLTGWGCRIRQRASVCKKTKASNPHFRAGSLMDSVTVGDRFGSAGRFAVEIHFANDRDVLSAERGLRPRDQVRAKRAWGLVDRTAMRLVNRP